jgi:hypothetical protein
MTLNRSIRWRGLDLETLEHAHIVAGTSGTRIRGAVIGPDFGLFYRIKLDENGHTRTVRIDRADSGSLELFADGAGSWSDDRAEPIPALRGCIDVDIWPSPVTNALPIRRTEWTDDQPIRFAMTWIDATTLTFQRAEQIYTRLDATRFRFQSADFEAVITVDEDGLVENYPGLFTRVDAA